MLYAIIATDVANSLEARLAARPAHLERLQQLKAEGRIVLAGPHPAIDSNDPCQAPPTAGILHKTDTLQRHGAHSAQIELAPYPFEIKTPLPSAEIIELSQWRREHGSSKTRH